MRISPKDLWSKILNGQKLIDVRAPVEFAIGTLPGAENFPIMNDEERAAVGTVYKKKGSEAAKALGYSLVSGEVKSSRVQAWQKYIQQNPETIIFCFRGGLRSQITQAWLAEAGTERTIVEGGYKAVRQLILERVHELSMRTDFFTLSGMTGSGKTRLLDQPEFQNISLNLEKIAKHRGSAFGNYEKQAQPSQVNFENSLALQWDSLFNSFTDFCSSGESSLENFRLVIEDESRMVGRCALPEELFSRFRASPVVLIEENLESRTEETFRDYILEGAIGKNEPAFAEMMFERYIQSVKNIEKKLGGLRAKEVLADLSFSKSSWLEHREIDSNKIWISKLLQWYYDPLYLSSRDKRKPHIMFKGSRAEVQEFLLQKFPREK